MMVAVATEHSCIMIIYNMVDGLEVMACYKRTLQETLKLDRAVLVLLITPV